MTLSKLYNSLDKDSQEGLVCGLVWGLVSGLACGLVWGLVSGLAWGLVCGLVSGLAWGLVSGLVCGLVWGLVSGLAWGLVVILTNWSEALPFITSAYPILLLIVGVIALAEILFWLMPKEKVRSEKMFWHTCKRKFECIFEVLMGLSGIVQVYILIRELKIKITPEIIHGVLIWIGYIGAGIVILSLVVGVFYVWIKLNSYKYKR